MNRPLSLVLFALILSASDAVAQLLQLRQGAGPASGITAGVGDTVEIEIHTDLQSFSASGFALYLSLPSGSFGVVGATDSHGDIRPFQAGELFDGAVELANALVPRDRAAGVPEGRFLLHYATVLGPGGQRSRAGSGILASIRLQVREAVHKAEIALHSDPVHESLLVFPDGRSERHFYLDRALQLTVGLPWLSAPVQSRSWSSVKDLYSPPTTSQ